MDASVDKPVSANDTAQGELQVVEFILGDEHFAINLFDVKEVVEYTTITKLPQVRAYIRGIIDLRGEITTIIDLKQRLNISGGSTGIGERSRIIVLDEKIIGTKIGILVDDVTSVSTFAENQIDRNSALITKKDTSINGIIKRKLRDKEKSINELIIWIDIRQLLADIDLSS